MFTILFNLQYKFIFPPPATSRRGKQKNIFHLQLRRARAAYSGRADAVFRPVDNPFLGVRGPGVYGNRPDAGEPLPAHDGHGAFDGCGFKTVLRGPVAFGRFIPRGRVYGHGGYAYRGVFLLPEIH